MGTTTNFSSILWTIEKANVHLESPERTSELLFADFANADTVSQVTNGEPAKGSSDKMTSAATNAQTNYQSK